MQKLKPSKIEKIKQKLITVTPLGISMQNDTKHEIQYECEETIDGVKPKILIRIRRIRKKLKRNKKVKSGGEKVWQE